MLVKFLQDYQGKETHETYYKQGEEVELPDGMALLLIAEKRAKVAKEKKVVENVETADVFENVTNVETEVVDVSKPAGEVNVVGTESYFADEPEEVSPVDFLSNRKKFGEPKGQPKAAPNSKRKGRK